MTKLMLVIMMMIMMTFIPENCPALINRGCFLGDRAVELWPVLIYHKVSCPSDWIAEDTSKPEQYLTFNTLSLKFQATEGKSAFSSQAHPCQEFTLNNDSSPRYDKKTVTGSGPA